MNADEFTTKVRIFPGYDYRDEPNDQRGAHNLSMQFELVGPLGAISWTLNTGWMKNPLKGALAPGGPQDRADKPGADFRLREYSPSAGGVYSHSHAKAADWWLGPNECDILGGQCYGNSGYLVGDTVLAAMFDDGHEGVWRELRVLYDAWLEPEAANESPE